MFEKRLRPKTAAPLFEPNEALKMADEWMAHMRAQWFLSPASESFGHRVCQLVPVPCGIFNDTCARVLERLRERRSEKFVFPFMAISASPDARDRCYEARGEYVVPEACGGCSYWSSALVAVVLRGELTIHTFPRKCKNAVTLTRTTKSSNAKPRAIDATASNGVASLPHTIAAGEFEAIRFMNMGRFRPQPVPGTMALLFFATGTEAAFDRWALRAFYGRLDASVEAMARNGLRLYPAYEARLSDEARRRILARKDGMSEDDAFFEVTRCPQPLPTKTR
jgi:hypothetical protein